jgi:FMN reductase [NAD(P)H]
MAPISRPFAEIVRARRMVRAYRPDTVDRAVIQRILDAAVRAPSAGYSQGQSFVVVTDETARKQVAEVCREPSYRARGFTPWISIAPVLVVPCVRETAYQERYAAADKIRSVPPCDWPIPFWWVDAGAALMLLLLAAVDEHLAAGFLAADPAGLRAVLGIPADIVPLGVVTIGHPAPDRRPGSLRRSRRPLDEVIHWQQW